MTKEEREGLRARANRDQIFARPALILQLLDDLDAKDAEIAALHIEVKLRITEIVILTGRFARANKHIEALKRERDELQCDYDSVGERLDERSKQLAAAEATLRKIAHDMPTGAEDGLWFAHDMQNVARAYFTAKGEKP